MPPIAHGAAFDRFMTALTLAAHDRQSMRRLPPQHLLPLAAHPRQTEGPHSAAAAASNAHSLLGRRHPHAPTLPPPIFLRGRSEASAASMHCTATF